MEILLLIETLSSLGCEFRPLTLTLSPTGRGDAP
jgi:hypothetical protein